MLVAGGLLILSSSRPFLSLPSNLLKTTSVRSALAQPNGVWSLFRDHFAAIYDAVMPLDDRWQCFLPNDEHFILSADPFTPEGNMVPVKAPHTRMSPDSGSLPAEFYKCFQSILCGPLATLFHGCLASGLLCPSMRKSAREW